jgi:predicted dehydrogenase
VRIGLIGLGAQALRRHVPALSSLNLFPVAVYDPSPRAVEEFESRFRECFESNGSAVSPVCADLEELQSRIDVADVVIPPANHVQVFSKLLELGIPFLSEKPFCRSWPEARHVQDVASSRGIKVGYLENWIFDPVIDHVEAIIDSGELGELQRISVLYPNAGLSIYPNQTTWRAHLKQGGGALLDWGSHGVGLAWYLAGISSRLMTANALDLRRTQSRILINDAFETTDAEDIAVFELAFETPEGRVVIADIDSSWGATWMWTPGRCYPILHLEGYRGALEATVENSSQGRHYRLKTDSREIDLGTLKEYDPTASAIQNALSGIIDSGVVHMESSVDLGTNVQLALGAVRLSAHLQEPVTPDEFVQWCSSFQEGSDDPVQSWDRALERLSL